MQVGLVFWGLRSCRNKFRAKGFHGSNAQNEMQRYFWYASLSSQGSIFAVNYPWNTACAIFVLTVCCQIQALMIFLLMTCIWQLPLFWSRTAWKAVYSAKQTRLSELQQLSLMW